MTSPKLKNVALIPNSITAIGLAVGLFVIFRANMATQERNMYVLLHSSALLLLVVALADFIDGAVARLVKGESEFGVLFDSLCDGISFGVAPSVLLLKSLHMPTGTVLSFFTIASAMVFTMCGIYRLVRFTVCTNPYRNEFLEQHTQKKNFTGLPIPAAASAVVSANLFLLSPYVEALHPLSKETIAGILICLFFLCGMLMISRLKFPSLKTLKVRVRSATLLISSVFIALCLMYGILYFFPILFALLSLGYITVGLFLSCVRFVIGRRSSVLEDYDMEE